MKVAVVHDYIKEYGPRRYLLAPEVYVLASQERIYGTREPLCV